MAAGNPVIATDMFAERYLFWTDGLAVKFSTDLRAGPFTAFSQEVADSPIDALSDQAGLLSVTYLDAAGNRVTKSSQLDGDTGSWS